MTDRYSAFIVTLAEDVRDDDAEAAVTALRMVRGVIRVEPVTASIDQQIATHRADAAWRNHLVALLRQPGPLSTG